MDNKETEEQTQSDNTIVEPPAFRPDAFFNEMGLYRVGTILPPRPQPKPPIQVLNARGMKKGDKEEESAPTPLPVIIPDDKTIGQQIGFRLHNLLKLTKAHKWVYFEWFYSYIDKPLFYGNNDFQIYLQQSFGRLKTGIKLTRKEWSLVRSKMRKPRRCSQSYFAKEREELERRRQNIRLLQTRKSRDMDFMHDLPNEIPLPLPVGTKVTARLRTPLDGIFTGKVDTVDSLTSTYRITFDKPGLGTHSIPDYELASNDFNETISINISLQKFNKDFQDFFNQIQISLSDLTKEPHTAAMLDPSYVKEKCREMAEEAVQRNNQNTIEEQTQNDNTIDEPIGQQIGFTLRNLVMLSKVHKWLFFEYFYSYIDKPLFDGNNDFRINFQQSREEWSKVRSKMRKPRRCSQSYFAKERKELERRRQKIRLLQTTKSGNVDFMHDLPNEIPLPLPVGTKVTARLRTPLDGIFTGKVDTVDSLTSTYRITFDKPGLGTHSIPDYELASNDFNETISNNISMQKFNKDFQDFFNQIQISLSDLTKEPHTAAMRDPSYLKEKCREMAEVAVQGNNQNTIEEQTQNDNTIDEPIGQQIGFTLRNLVMLSKVHKWLFFEYFYSYIDKPLFDGNNDFRINFQQSREEWSKVRSKMRKPRRCSQSYFAKEREELERRRQNIRLLQTIKSRDMDFMHDLPNEIPLPLPVGTKVTARLRTPLDGIFTGKVDTVDSLTSTYRITFDKPGLGTHSIPDYELASNDFNETISNNISMQKFNKDFQDFFNQIQISLSDLTKEPHTAAMRDPSYLKEKCREMAEVAVQGNNQNTIEEQTQNDNTIDEPIGQQIGFTLRNLVMLSKVHKWLFFEYFYSYIDKPLFDGNNDFRINFQQSREEWSKVRSKMRKPRRCSQSYFAKEREELERRRQNIRLLQTIKSRDMDFMHDLPNEIPLPLPVGTKVTARLRTPLDGIFTGKVDTVDSLTSTYRITFDKPGLGTHSIPDYELASNDFNETISNNISMQKFNKDFQDFFNQIQISLSDLTKEPHTAAMRDPSYLKEKCREMAEEAVQGNNQNTIEEQTQNDNTIDEPIGQQIGFTLRNLVMLSKVHKWLFFEYFYSYIDKPLFDGNNDFRINFQQSREEWSKVRSKMRKPRRCSQSYFAKEREELERRRQNIRLLQTRKSRDMDFMHDLPNEIPLPLPVGTKVTARLRTPLDGIFTGKVDTVDSLTSTYRITFDKPGLGTHSIPDYELASNDFNETISINISLQKCNKDFQDFFNQIQISLSDLTKEPHTAAMLDPSYVKEKCREMAEEAVQRNNQNTIEEQTQNDNTIDEPIGQQIGFTLRNRRRQNIHLLQTRKSGDMDFMHDLPNEIPLPLPVGTKVTARLRTPQDGIFTGKVDSVNSLTSTYRITFDKPGLGTHLIPDYELVANDFNETISLSSLTQDFLPLSNKFD